MIARSARTFAAAAALLAAAACSNRKTPVPGTTCLLNSDCENPLSCSYGKCHEACQADGDCPGAGRCVYAAVPEDGGLVAGPSAGGLKVCIQDTCALNSVCPDPLVCGRDLQCRQECADKRDCPGKNDECVVGGRNGEKVCAEPEAIEDGGVRIVDGGLPPPADGSVAGDAADASAGGSDGATDAVADTAGANDAGADAPTDAPNDAPPSPDGGAPPDAPADAGAPDGAGAADAGPMVVPEMEPNDDRTMATTYVLGTSVAATSSLGDNDYYAVTAPAGDPGGGYFQGAVTSVGTAGAVHVSVYSTADDGIIRNVDGAGAGQQTFFYWSASPGQTYRVLVYEAGPVTGTFPYTLTLTYHKVDDPYEPDDTRDQPKPIALGAPVNAFFFTGYVYSQIAAADQDWYSVELGAGMTTLNVTNVPSDLRMQVQLLDSTHSPQQTFVGTGLGADVSGKLTVAPGAAGTYYFIVQAFSFNVGSSSGTGPVPPDSFTRAYTLKVTQP